MNSTRATGILVLALLLISQAAMAGNISVADHGPTAIVPVAIEGARAVGDDCTDPIVIPGLPYSDMNQTNCGRGNHYEDTCLGWWDAGEDIVYEFTLAAMTFVKITVDPQGTRYGSILIDDTCPADLDCIAFFEGAGYGPMVMDLALEAGTYYLMIDSWPPPECLPAFDLTVEEFVPPCAEAIDLQIQSLTTFEINTCGGGADLSPTNGCTGFAVGAPSEDLEYKIYLTAGETFAVNLTGEDVYQYDAAIYLLADCLDMDSCVAGGDDHENFSYEVEADGWYYLIVDGVSGCGTATVTIDSPVGAELNSWGTVKSMYR